VDDLGDGDVVAVESGTTGEAWAEENLAPNGVEVRAFPEAPDTYTALEAGEVDGVIFDESSAIPEASERDLEVAEAIDTGETYGIAVNPGNTELLDAIDGALQEMIDDGTYDQIYDGFPDCSQELAKNCLVPGGRVTA
jgi:polar amino acid transport system substrate-binding protein